MAQFKLHSITLTVKDRASGLRNKEYIVYSLFEADRTIEAIRSQSDAVNELELHFRLSYSENEKPRSYQGIFRYAGKSGPLSLQQHILDFFENFNDRLDVLKITPEAFAKLRSNMVQLFDSCATEQMFSINRKVEFNR